MTANATALLDTVAAIMAQGRTAESLRLIQTRYPIPKGWVPAVEPNAPAQWGRGQRQIVTQRNGILYAGGRDWFTKTGAGLHVADQVNANPAGGQYVLRQSANHTALVAPRPRQLLPDAPLTLIGGNGNYFHWLLDYLPRVPLALAEDRDSRLVVGARLTAFERESLRGLGVEPDRLVPLDLHQVSHFRRLRIPDLGTIDRIPHPQAIEWLRSTFQTGIGLRRRLWLSRSDAAVRRVVNEEAVIEALAPLGFESVSLDGLSISEQANMFAGAEIVAGPHGATFANLVFAAPGTRVVELVPGDYRPVFFPALADNCGLKHVYLPCVPHPTEHQSVREHPRNWDMVADIQALLRVFHGVVAR